MGFTDAMRRRSWGPLGEFRQSNSCEAYKSVNPVISECQDDRTIEVSLSVRLLPPMAVNVPSFDGRSSARSLPHQFLNLLDPSYDPYNLFYRL